MIDLTEAVQTRGLGSRLFTAMHSRMDAFRWGTLTKMARLLLPLKWAKRRSQWRQWFVLLPIAANAICEDRRISQTAV
jgi:hypothetical protein